MAADQALHRLTVLLVTFQSAHCAPAMGKALKAFPNIIVVDNDSADRTVEAFQRELPQARAIRNPKNLGFGAANNRGVDASSTEFVLLLNPDCIIDESAAHALVSCADQFPSASAIGPQLIDRHGHPDRSYSMGATFWEGKGNALAEGHTSVRFISGACMLIRRAAMNRVQGFDEGFFLYYEDTDLCLRLSDQAGEIIVEPQAKVTHLSHGSSGGKAQLQAEYLRGYHHIQSKFLFEKKHFGKSVSTLRRTRYAALAAIECGLRAMLLDRVRAARGWGRVMGSLRYNKERMPPPPH